MKMVWDAREVFAKDDFIMDVKTEDNVPVQKSYNSIPRPLYQDVKQHIEDMLNQCWIKMSKSPMVLASSD